MSRIREGRTSTGLLDRDLVEGTSGTVLTGPVMTGIVSRVVERVNGLDAASPRVFRPFIGAAASPRIAAYCRTSARADGEGFDVDQGFRG
ncbi:hypothetical protein AB0G54_38520 [Streptomyces yokosukanensis]|uniref:hypothetical protein n=1 Tax=Streptomyces yokosukanensis TaxID=67386 RepID=UPI00131E8224|nr:hypothetical protein [Streptomyces yokosukanensis]